MRQGYWRKQLCYSFDNAADRNSLSAYYCACNESSNDFIRQGIYPIIMKPIGEIEEKLASKAEPILGFKPSSKIKRGPIGILISIVCVVIVYLELNRTGVI